MLPLPLGSTKKVRPPAAATKTRRFGAGHARGGAYLEVASWATAMREGKKPTDGAFVTFWRLLVKYPEILAWERLWNEALYDTYRDLCNAAHEIGRARG